MSENEVTRPSENIINRSLVSAVREGGLEKTRELIDNYGLNYSEEWLGGYFLLCDAIKNNHTAIAKLLLSRGARFNRYINETNKCSKYQTPLHLAVKAGETELVKIILDKGCHVNDKNQFGETPLHCAVQKKNIDVIRLLIEHGANVNATDSSGITPLHHAVTGEEIQIVELLIKHGSDVKCVVGYNQITLLHFAVKKIYNNDIVTFLLSKGADINTNGKNNVSPLHMAIMAGRLEIVKHLLEHGSDIHSVYGYKEYTPLHYAVEKNYKAIVTLLLSKGANVNSQSKYGSTPLHVATIKGLAEVVEVLLEYNADINLVNNEDTTPLHLSAERGYEDITIMLLSKGANVNAKQNDESTALHLATLKGFKQVVKLLVDSGAKVDFKNKNGLTPLHLGAQTGNQDIVELILKLSVDVDSKDKHGKTALHMASHDGHVVVVETLLMYGSDINITCNNNLTVLNYAKKQWNNLDVFFGYNGVNSCLTVEALERHILKLQGANLYLNTNLLPVSQNQDLIEFQNTCECEIARMKIDKFNYSNVSFYNILGKCTNTLAIYMRNENIVQVLRSGNYKTKYPTYSSMIESNFRKGMYRKELLEQCNQVVLFIFTITLPHNCIAKVYNYLNNKDLQNLLEAFVIFQF